MTDAPWPDSPSWIDINGCYLRGDFRRGTEMRIRRAGVRAIALMSKSVTLDVSSYVVENADGSIEERLAVEQSEPPEVAFPPAEGAGADAWWSVAYWIEDNGWNDPHKTEKTATAYEVIRLVAVMVRRLSREGEGQEPLSEKTLAAFGAFCEAEGNLERVILGLPLFERQSSTLFLNAEMIKKSVSQAASSNALLGADKKTMWEPVLIKHLNDHPELSDLDALEAAMVAREAPEVTAAIVQLNKSVRGAKIKVPKVGHLANRIRKWRKADVIPGKKISG